MELTKQTTTDRLFYLDNIRYLLVLLVVVLHAACAYSHYTQWWPVNDENTKFFDGVLRIMDIFLMPGLFFIAGYFALPSLKKQRYNTWGFIKKKLIRLGIPWLIGVALLGPIRLSIFEYTRFDRFDLWGSIQTLNQTAFSFYTGIIDSSYQFSHIHFWFISLLLLFFIAFALLHKGKNLLFGSSHSSGINEVPPGKSILITLFSVGFLSALITFFIHGLFANSTNKDPWLLIGNLIQFQPTKITLYLLNFGLGIHAFHRRWFLNGKAPGHFLFWLALSAVLWFCWEAAITILFQNFSIKMAVIVVLIRPILYFSILLTLITFGIKYWQSRSTINRTLSDNSYAIYIVHLFFVWIMQLLFLGRWGMSVYLKFALVSFTSVLLSWMASHYIVRKAARNIMNLGRSRLGSLHIPGAAVERD